MTAPAQASGSPTGFGSAVIDGRSGFDPERAEGGGSGQSWRSFSTSVRLGWAMEANWTDPLLFFIYSVAKPVSAALILVFMLEVIAGASSRQYRGFVIVGSALWAIVLTGIAGLAWSILEDRERYRMIKYIYVSPSDFLLSMTGRAVARAAVGAMGALITLAVGVVILGVPFDPLAVDWPLLLVVTVGGVVAVVALGMLLGAVVMQTRQEAWQYPEAVAGALFLVSGAVFPLSVLPMFAQVVGMLLPLAWWIEGTRQALFPGGLSSIGGEGSAWLAVTGTMEPTATQVVAALLVTGGVCTLVSVLAFRRSERRAKDRGLLDQTTGSLTTRRPERREPMRIYEGSPRQDFEEVLRSIGAFLDQRGMRDVLVLEAPDGFIVQGLVTSGGATGTWSESMGTEAKETLTFLDDDIARFMEEAVARRGRPGPSEPSAAAGRYEHAFRVIGRYLDSRKPHDIFFFEQGGAFVVRILMAGQQGKHHELVEFTADDVTQLVSSGPELRQPDPTPGSAAAPHG